MTVLTAFGRMAPMSRYVAPYVPAFISSSSTAGTNPGSGNMTLAYPGSYAPGDSLYVAVMNSASTPAGFSVVNVTSTGASTLRLYHRLLDGSESGSITMAAAAFGLTYAIGAALYRAGRAPITSGTAADTGGSDMAATAPSLVVPAKARLLAFYIVGSGILSGGLYTGPTGMTRRINPLGPTGYDIVSYDQSLTVAGATGTRVFDWSASGAGPYPWGAISVLA